MFRWKKIVGAALIGLTALVIIAGVTIGVVVRTSLPQPGIGGKIPGLKNEVRIEQDSLGVPIIRASSMEDVYRAQGWITARDRLFQMDLLRRRSAGRLAEIFGKEALEFDWFHRKLGLKRVVTEAVKQMSGNQKRYLQCYADGVNAYLAQGPLPFEMRVLGYKPDRWSSEDSLLVLLAMFVDLDFYNQYLSERALTLLYEKRPKMCPSTFHTIV